MSAVMWPCKANGGCTRMTVQGHANVMQGLRSKATDLQQYQWYKHAKQYGDGKGLRQNIQQSKAGAWAWLQLACSR